MSVGITATTLVISSQDDEREYVLQHRPEVVCIERTLIFWLSGSLKQPAYKFNSQGWDTRFFIRKLFMGEKPKTMWMVLDGPISILRPSSVS